jgi:Uma2 family endonuclease
MNLVLDDTTRIPLASATSLDDFRRWTKSADYPERGDYSYLGRNLWVVLSPESFAHNQLKGAVTSVVGSIAMDDRLGRYFASGMRLVHEAARLSTEPDSMFVRRDSLRSRCVCFEEGAESREVIGTPDMVLEVVSPHSIHRDTIALRELYAAAGIAEYWLVNSIDQHPALDILRLTAKGYASIRKAGGWSKSGVFGKSFRLEAQEADDGLPDYRLLVK